MVNNPFKENNYYLNEMHRAAVLLHARKTDKSSIFSGLSVLSEKNLLEMKDRYKDSTGPVNLLREEIATKLLEKKSVDARFIDARIKEIESESGKRSFKLYEYFSILFPFFHSQIEFNVKEALTELSTAVMTGLQLKDKGKTLAVDFWGTRGFGDDGAWTAIYNSTHRNLQTAKQLLIKINKDGLHCGVYDRLNQEFLAESPIEINENSLESIINFFQPFADHIREDEYSKARFLSLGVKGTKFYKLSHGELFTQDQIQECLDSNIAVVREFKETTEKTSFLPYDVFVEAKKGDYFYSCWGKNQQLVIGQFIDSEIRDCSLDAESKGWKERSYRIIQQVQLEESYRGPKKGWAPNGEYAFIEVPESDYELINEIILRPYFQAELNPDKATPQLTDKVGVSTKQEIKVQDDGVKPKLDVEIVAREFANIIDNLEDNKGQMLGVFGNWGRGKTFFVDRVKAQLAPKQGEKVKYINVTFNAWKYQETEAIWAYLYEVILDSFLAEGVSENSTGIKRKVVSRTRTFFLNFKRKGYLRFVGIFLSFIASLVVAFVVSSSVKLQFANYLITAIGVIGLIQAYVLYRRYYQGIKDVLNDYSTRHSYRSVLGLQAEIQDELIILVKHWLKAKDDRRIVLFVDDLDRCDEDNIIRIIDALRVALDNDYLVKKLIIIVAVDEFLLERAIQAKYVNFHIQREDKNLVQEYMDKLFIAAIKFPSLKQDEQAIILENYANKGGILEKSKKAEMEPEKVTALPESTSVDKEKGFVFPEPELTQSKVVESEFFLLRTELAMLQEFSNDISSNVTPRGLRIYMYRYLLSKNLLSNYMTKHGNFQIGDSECKILAKAIASKSSKWDFSINDLDEFRAVENQELREFLPKLIEMVVPY